MNNIKIDELNQGKKLTAEDINNVKGGIGYIKIGDIKGESRATSGGGSGKVSLQDFHF